ncbi:hypothetical protein FS837_009233 [Tulasnella sp. UAMH 9824]|nr:hypothetical protein FS837_009233 [Tulasnella sp. UAMH 9824]
MEGQAEVQSQGDPKACAVEIDQEAIVKSLQRLLTQLAAPNQDPDSPLLFPTTREDLNSLVAICKEIENEAGRLVTEHSIKRNTFLLIHQFPTNIIVKILHFALALEVYTWRGHKQTFLHRQKDLRLVCTHWNGIIKATPSFWGTVSCADVHEGRLRAALKLSGDAPLEIVCRSGGALKSAFNCRPFAAEISEVAHRWGSLDVQGQDWTEHFSSPTPKLTSLTIKGKPGLDTGHLCPGTFLGGDASKLRNIVLKHSDVPWDDWPVLSSLDILEIRCVSQGPAVAQVLKILGQCKQLQKFIVYQTWIQPLPGDTWSAEHAPIDLPTLRTLNFERVRLDSVVQILNTLRLSGLCRLRITAQNHESSFGPFMEFVRRRIPENDTNGDAADTLCLDLDGTPTIGLAFPRHLSKLHFTLIDSKWDDERVKWKDCSMILRAIRPAFPSTETDPGVNLWILRRQIKQAFELLRDTYPNLTRLCTVTDRDTLSLFSKPQPLDGDEGDATATGENGAEKPQRWLFPKLEDLHLYSRPNTTGLLEFVEARRNNPQVKPIIKLVIDNSETPEEVRNKLKDWIPDLRFRVI